MKFNRSIVLKRRPRGIPALEDFELRTASLRPLEEAEILLEHLFLSIDPAIRGWMADKKSYLPPIALGEPIRSGTLSRIAESRDPRFPVGTLVQAIAAWEERSIVRGEAIMGEIKRIPGIPLAAHLSVLGGNGLTAYFGLFEIGRPQPGETVVITAAAGGVGMVASQLAKIHGARVIGIAGGEEKKRFLLEDLGLDCAIDYKNEDVNAALKAAAPRGIDVFFDSVGGELLEIGLARLALRGRIVLCGAISQIHEETPPAGPRNYVQLLAKRGRMEGFVTLDYAKRYDEARAILADHIRSGALVHRDEIVSGLEHTPQHFLRLFDGSHRGKLMVQLQPSGEEIDDNDRS
ncbi:MAG: NADP-dependent oxidoreductase [Sandaracinaceae bacterium]|nr:NADP-dependent oxidoreductase [Sandaracinaceae bacterium]